MKYYYGNSYTEAISNKPINIKSIKRLQELYDNYSFVIPEDEI